MKPMNALLGTSIAAGLVGFSVFVAAPSAQAPRIDAKALYAKHCQNCHGENGKSSDVEMGFTERTWKHGTKTAEIGRTISAGLPDTDMLPWQETLNPREIAALAAFVRSLDKRLPPEKSGGY